MPLTPSGMRTTIAQIGDSLDLYYRGSSLTDIASHLKTTYDNIVEQSTIYRWLLSSLKRLLNCLTRYIPMLATHGLPESDRN